MSLSRFDVLKVLKDFNNKFGKTQKRVDEDNPWKKKSIFFDLPYWEYNLLRHNLDVMHIEKNVYDSLLATLLDIDGKTKDHLKGRLDLQDLGIRKELHPRTLALDKILLPPVCFSMTSKEKGVLCEVLKGLKIPNNHATNISRCVNLKEHKVSGLKSYDCHFLMHYVLHIVVRKVLPKHVVKVLIRLSAFFLGIYTKVIQLEEFERLEKEIAVVLCELERIFPPSFFDIMIHLPIHLAREGMLGGPVQYRCMYAVESVETRFNRPYRNYDDAGMDSQKSGLFPRMGRFLDSGEISTLDFNSWIQAHRYFLVSYVACKEHEKLIMQCYGSRKWNRARSHSLEFHEWFKTRVRNQQVLEEIKWLSRRPSRVVRRLKGFIVNGFRFHTQDREKKIKTQNSGVVITALTESYASSQDQNPIKGNVTYYGVLKDIIELDYYGNFNVVVFKCDWFQVKQDEFGFLLVNFTRLTCQNDPFVLASQVQQVFYIQDPIEKDWHVVIKLSGPRDLYDMFRSNEDIAWQIDNEPNVSFSDPIINVSDDSVSYSRDDMDGVTINKSLDGVQIEK
ncbi:PREDICTED: uncharacterized protein LOC108663018 [Theobroma cacao]|uniref:Uncharacterized protein LOC108663018 n=1 Tax=Theobroma cacao TaxID=3641 RepID=A0AB32WPI5_THECC|nr:PREDICTED: uncharacterized protein LOC108663018 [Theobroma cacao]